MPFFSRVFKGKESSSKVKKPVVETNGQAAEPAKPRWEESWSRTEVEAEEIQELVHICTQEMKSRGKWDSHRTIINAIIKTLSPSFSCLPCRANSMVSFSAIDTPFFLLPFRPGVDQSAAKLFIRSFFKAKYERSPALSGEYLQRELRLTDPMVS